MCVYSGIFVDDILEAMPIDKYFELFKPNMGGEGGYIRICLNYAKDAKSQGEHSNDKCMCSILCGCSLQTAARGYRARTERF